MLKDVNRGMKGELKGASPHTIWVRDDLWEAVIQFKLHNKDSLRSVVEQALVMFLQDVNKPNEPDTDEIDSPEKWGNA